MHQQYSRIKDICQCLELVTQSTARSVLYVRCRTHACTHLCALLAVASLATWQAAAVELLLLLLLINLLLPARLVRVPLVSRLPPAVVLVLVVAIEAATAAGGLLRAARGGRAGSPAGPDRCTLPATDSCGDADLHVAPQAAKDPPLPHGRAAVMLLLSVGPAAWVAMEGSRGAAAALALLGMLMAAALGQPKRP